MTIIVIVVDALVFALSLFAFHDWLVSALISAVILAFYIGFCLGNMYFISITRVGEAAYPVQERNEDEFINIASPGIYVDNDRIDA